MNDTRNLFKAIEELLNEVRHHDLPAAVEDCLADLMAE